MMLSSSSFSSGDKDMEDMGKRFRAFMNQHWYAEAIDVCRQWLEKSRSVLGPDHPDSLKVMYLLGMAFHAHGKYTDAENIFRQLLELKQDDVTTLDALCETLCNLRKYDESMRLLQDELRLCEDSLGLRHELTIKTLRNIAQVYKLQDNLYLASSVLLRALELSKTGLGENHPIPLAIQEELDEIRGPQDTLALRQALAVKHGLPIPGDVLAGFKTIDASSILLQSYAEVLGFVSGGTDVVNTTMRRLAEMTGHSPQPALHLPSAFESDTSGDEAPEVLESSNYVGVTEVSPIVSTAADNPTAAVALTRSSDPFRCLVDRSIQVWHRTKTRRGRTRAIARHSHLLRSVETLDDFLCSPTLQYWFFQLREAFMEQKSFQKWSPDRLDDYILLPIEAGFANDKDCMFISHYWHEPDHPDYHGEDLQPLQELLRDGLWGQITLFWVDFTCLPQRDRTGPQRQYFSRALKSIPRLVRDCAFVWRFSQFQPRLWVLFEAAEFTRNRSRSIPLADIEPFMQHLREMKGYGVRYVLSRHGYRCVNQTDRELVVGWLEILIILSRLVPSIRTRRIILNAIDNSMVRTCFHEQSGIAVDKAKGLITLDDRTYYFNPVPFDEAGPQADVRIPLDSWREAHLRKEILRAERAPDDRGYEEIAKENECEGEYEISEKLHRKSLDIAREKSAIEIIVSLDYLAGNLEKQRRYDEAEKLRREQVTVAAAAAEEQRGPDGELEEKLAMTMQNGRLAMYFRRWKGEALETLLEVERPSFQETGQSHANFAEIADQTPQDLKSQGKFKEAKEMLWLLLEWRKTNLGPYHPKTSMTLSNLGTVFRLEGSLIVAERLFWIALALIDDIWGSEHCNTLAIMSELALTLYSRGMKAEAREIYRQQLERQLKTVDFHHPDTFTVKFNLMEVLDRNETFRVMYGRVQIVSDDRI